MLPHAPTRRPSDPVRVLVEDVPDLAERVRVAARRARASARVFELVEPAVPAYDHEARAGVIRRMDEALDVARRAAPGLEIRVGGPIELPRPRSTT